MRALFWAGLAGGVALLGWGFSRAAAPRGRVLLVGDSLAVGLAGPLRTLGINLDSSAVVGITIGYWLTTGAAKLHGALAAKPGLILISLGTNDAYSSATQERLEADARKLLAQLVASGAAVVWIGPPPLPSQYGSNLVDMQKLAAIQRAVESTQFATWIDSSGLQLPRAADGLHLTDAGYTTWAEILVRELAEAQPETRARTTIFGEDPPEVVPPPPVNVKLPAGWKRLKFADMPTGMSAKAINVLAERRPLGDIQTWSMGGRTLGIFTELHWDDHVGNRWQWHRGVSAVEKVSQ